MKRYLFSTILVALAVMPLMAQVAKSFKVNISDDGEAWMQVYMPKNPTGRAIVDCPGGGYSGLAMDHEGYDWVPYFTERGITFAVLKYRMPKGDRTIPMGDAQAAVKMMRDSADVWKVNPNDVGIMGFSAGGHLASTVATHSPLASRPNFQILFYPVISMQENETHKGSWSNFLGKDKNDEKLCKEFSNYTQIRRHETPPAIILMSQDDFLVPTLTNGILYYSAMTKVGVACTMHIYPIAGHGWGYRESFPYHYNMLNDLSTWLSMLDAPKKDAVKVACIGNSITDGHGIRVVDADSYPAQLQKILGNGYYVRNYGVSGRTMLNNGNRPYMKEKAWKEAQEFNPDVVVIKLGTNDSKPLNWDAHSKEFAADMQQMIDALNALPSKPKIYLCTPIAGNHQAGNQPDNQCRDNIIREEVIPQILKVAKKNKLEVIDLYPVVNLDNKDMQRDMLHPTEAGAKKIAKAVAEVISKK
ncbi:MAG: GDSL-type esterase/lipase family protein [Bacteroidaceae bacterium]|nr:GDSL-type esterase/lipase family protein [Bacteroidaceae bacterium]